MTDAQIEGFTLSGEEIAQLTDKHFTIHAEPRYEQIPDLSNPEKNIKKLVVPVTLANGIQVEWYANKTSQKMIMARAGRSLKKWVGFKGLFDVRNQRVGKEDRDVLYVSAF